MNLIGSPIPIAADVDPGDVAVFVAYMVPAGTLFGLFQADSLVGGMYVARSVSGDGPFKVTLDRPVPVPFLVSRGDYAQAYRDDGGAR